MRFPLAAALIGTASSAFLTTVKPPLRVVGRVMMSTGPTDATAEIDDKSGAFVRTDSTFRHMISKEDEAAQGLG